MLKIYAIELIKERRGEKHPKREEISTDNFPILIKLHPTDPRISTKLKHKNLKMKKTTLRHIKINILKPVIKRDLKSSQRKKWHIACRGTKKLLQSICQKRWKLESRETSSNHRKKKTLSTYNFLPLKKLKGNKGLYWHTKTEGTYRQYTFSTRNVKENPSSRR